MRRCAFLHLRPFAARTGAVLLLVCNSAVAFGADPAVVAAPALTNALADRPAAADVAARLGHSVASVSFERAPLTDVLTIIETGAGVRIAPDWNALKAADIGGNFPITLHGANLSYMDYFNAIVQQTHAALALDYRTEDSAIVLTTAKAYTPLPPQSSAPAAASPYPSLVTPRRPLSTEARAAAPKSITAPADAGPTNPFDTPAEAATRRKLDVHIPQFRCNQLSLGNAIDALGESAPPVSFYVNWKALEAASITKDTPVSLNLQNVPLRKVLNTLLSEAGGGNANLGYTIDDGTVTISTKDDLDTAKYQTVQLFDVRDFLHAFPGHSADDIARQLIAGIENTVAPDSWKDNGGTIGSIRQLIDGRLLIVQTKDNQLAIYNVLNQLRTLYEIPVPRPHKERAKGTAKGTD